MRIPISSFGCSKCCTALRPRVLREPSSDARSIRATCGLPNLYSLKAIASVSIMTPRRHQSATRTVSPVGHVGRSSQPPAVGLYNSSAYRQAHSHSIGLGGEEGAEEPVEVFRCDADAGILDRHQNLTSFLPGPDQKIARPIRSSRHRLKPKHPAGAPMTLGNMRELGVRHDRRRRAPELA
jgi:hypothetical protein